MSFLVPNCTPTLFLNALHLELCSAALSLVVRYMHSKPSVSAEQDAVAIAGFDTSCVPCAAETAVDNLDDVISVKFIQEIMDWCGSHPVISRVSDTSRVYLCGHSRVRFS